MVNKLLEMKNIRKSFGATHALNGVDLDMETGEVHMLLGENGAGKSTLMKILAGSLQADNGDIFWQGEKVNLRTPTEAHRLGIGMVYQELSLFEKLSIFENVMVGRIPKLKRLPFIDWKKTEAKAVSALKKVGLGNLDFKKNIDECDLGTQQLVEIAKAISREAKLIILDEPTSALTKSETNKLMEVIKVLKEEGVSFIFITHKLEEVFLIGDRGTIFRDGHKIGDTFFAKEISEEEMIQRMVGRTIKELYPKEKNVVSSEKILEVIDLSNGKDFKNVNFSVKKGEVVGIAGLIGSGITEIAESIFGLKKYNHGKIIYNGKDFNPRNPADSLREGIGFLTKDRKSGLLLHRPIYVNITLSNLKKFIKFIFFRKSKLELQDSEFYAQKLNIVCRSVTQLANSLSGGNQQKVIISKLLCADCKLFIFDDPTRGIDVGSKVEVYKLMNELTRNRCGIIFISSEMPELLGMSDRILVSRSGTIVADMKIEECSQEVIMKKIAGGTASG